MTVLPFATQIKNAGAAIEANSPIEGKVIFCVQGVISPLLSNLYLHPLDEVMEAAGHRMIRYADDFVILCRDEAEAGAGPPRGRPGAPKNGLAPTPGKPHPAACRQAGQGFDFLGYRFENGRRFVRN